MTQVLGVYTGHDQAACLLRDGRIVAMIEEERLTRVKHGLPKSVRGLWAEFHGRFGYFPWASVAYCLEAGGIGLDDLDAIVLPEEGFADGMARNLPVKDRRKVIVAKEPLGGDHHYRHALSTFLASPFESAAVLVVDGDGTVTDQGYEAETGYVFDDRSGKCREVFKNRYPLGAGLRGGLGWTYDYVSAVLGFVATKIGYLSEPGKTMGLAPYGKKNPSLDRPWIRAEGFKLDFSPFHEWLVSSGLHKLVSFESREKALIQSEDAIPELAKDLAWKVQNELEVAILALAGRLHAATGAKDLCLAGGVALNCVANGLVLAKGPFARVFAQPAAHDAGQAIGLAYQGHRLVDAKTPIAPSLHAFGGRVHPDAELKSLLKQAALDFQDLRDDAALAQDAAQELASGKCLGWFQGGSEYGPRALGHRSILADPRGTDVKDRLNARVKLREPFRPFAPSVLRESTAEVFELEAESPYMLIAAPVRPEWRERVPAITHVDGTARVQTVDAAVDPLYHGLIAAFAKRTGVPLVLNTSFNLRGMPVVETPRDALQCFLYTELDVLYLGRFKVKRPDPARLFPSAAKDARLVVENTVSWGGASLELRYEIGDSRRRVPVKALPEVATFLGALDGKRSLKDAALAAGGADAVAGLTEIVRQLLRAGALVLRVGDVVL